MGLYTRFCSGVIFPLHEKLKSHDSVARLHELEKSQYLPRPQIEAIQTQHLKPIDLNEIVDSITGLIANQAGNQSVTVSSDLQKNLPLISVDAEQIKQVVLNLAINGLQAMSQSTGAEKTLSFKTFQQISELIIEVTDSGSGVDPKNLSKIFDPFYTTKEKGVGLGLSIAHKIVTQHGGHLTAKCTTHLTTFTLAIPLDPAPSS